MIWRVCLGRSWPNGEGTPFLLVPGALFKCEIMLHSKDQEATTPNFNVNKQNSSTFCSVILFFDFPAALLYQIPPVRLESSEWTSLGNNLGLAWDFIQVGTSLGSLTVAAPEVILQGILHPQSQAKIWLFEGGWTEHRTQLQCTQGEAQQVNGWQTGDKGKEDAWHLHRVSSPREVPFTYDPRAPPPSHTLQSLRVVWTWSLCLQRKELQLLRHIYSIPWDIFGWNIDCSWKLLAVTPVWKVGWISKAIIHTFSNCPWLLGSHIFQETWLSYHSTPGSKWLNVTDSRHTCPR